MQHKQIHIHIHHSHSLPLMEWMCWSYFCSSLNSIPSQTEWHLFGGTINSTGELLNERYEQFEYEDGCDSIEFNDDNESSLWNCIALVCFITTF